MSDVMCLHVSVYVLMEVLTRHVSDSTSAQHLCICHSARDQYIPSTTQSSWSPWERLTVYHTTFDYTRKLYNTSSSECLLQGYDTPVNIVSQYQLPDAIFSASSTYVSNFPSLHHAPYRVRIDMYYNIPGAWVAGLESGSEWLQIQLQSSYLVGGILIIKRLYLTLYTQYPNAITVKTAEDDLQWTDVIVNQNVMYADNEATL